MSDCCSPKGYRWFFSEQNARADAKHYRRKGLDATSRRIVDYLKDSGIEGRTILEVGGGIGAIQLELLKAGAARAVSVELTPTYEEVAAELAGEAGLADRIERKVMDFAEVAGEMESSDVVIMNRVVCCYPDMPKLVGAAADRSREVLVLSYPRETWWLRIVMRAGNFALRLTRREFQGFLHSPKKIIATSEQHGLKVVLDQPRILWTVAAMHRFGPMDG